MKLSSQGTIPFIKLNNYTVEDSHKCIEYLTEVFQKDLNSHLTEEQKALSRIFKAFIDRFAGYMAQHRFVLAKNGQKDIGLPLLSHWIFQYRVKRQMWYVGIGRMSKEDFYENGKKGIFNFFKQSSLVNPY
jgi:hypothetical protein